MKRNSRKSKASQLPAISRRAALGLIGTTAAASLLDNTQALGKVSALTVSGKAPALQPPSCVVRPQQTEGPYFVDERLRRADIRQDPADGTMKEGAALLLAFQVSQIRGENCTALADAVVDIWHCDAQGIYSDVRDRSFDTRGKKFLRGYQLTDENGMARFVTIFPGWYRGRATHIHFKIRSSADSGQAYEFTSQIYFDEAQIARIYNTNPYAGKGQWMKNTQDGIFRQGGEQLLLPLEKSGNGYAGTFQIGLQIT